VKWNCDDTTLTYYGAIELVYIKHEKLFNYQNLLLISSFTYNRIRFPSMYEHCWKEVVQFHKRSTLFRAAPYEWSKKERKFKTLIGQPNASRYRKAFRRLTWLITAHQAVVLWNLLQAFLEEKSLILKISSLWLASILMAITICRWIHLMKTEEITQFLNVACKYQSERTRRIRGK
jgi:hypothetical protein